MTSAISLFKSEAFHYLKCSFVIFIPDASFHVKLQDEIILQFFWSFCWYILALISIYHFSPILCAVRGQWTKVYWYPKFYKSCTRCNLFIVIWDVHQFSVHCLIPYDPWNCSILITCKNSQTSKNIFLF